MLLELSDEQEMLRAAAARYFADRCPITVVRGRIGEPSATPSGYLEDGASLGWFSFFVPEALGGGSVSPNPIIDAIVIAEARGAALQPGPFAGMNAVADTLSRSAGYERQLGAIGRGEVVAWVNGDVSALGVGGHALHVRADGDRWRIDGTVRVVDEALAARRFLITATTGGGQPAQFLVEAGHAGLSCEPVDSLDLTRRVARVHCNGVLCDASHRVGHAAAASGDACRQTDLGALLTAADSVGAVGRLFATTVEYAKVRMAFGRAIGGFQAIKHLLADLSLSLEMARALVAGAADALHRGAANASMLASAAAAFTADAAIEIAQGCFQVHGGVGHTWEHDLHLYLRRAAANTALFGTAVQHRERIVRLAEARSQ